MFNQLNFCQLVGGECRTIMKSSNPNEICGRLRVLSKVAYLYNQCGNWEKVRSVYYAVVDSIEEGKAAWTSSFGHCDLMCPPPPPGAWGEEKPSKLVNTKTPQRQDFFCKEFQKGECTQASPHRAWVRNNMETVEHYCVTCHHTKLGKLPHIPRSEQCTSHR